MSLRSRRSREKQSHFVTGQLFIDEDDQIREKAILLVLGLLQTCRRFDPLALRFRYVPQILQSFPLLSKTLYFLPEPVPMAQGILLGAEQRVIVLLNVKTRTVVFNRHSSGVAAYEAVNRSV